MLCRRLACKRGCCATRRKIRPGSKGDKHPDSESEPEMNPCKADCIAWRARVSGKTHFLARSPCGDPATNEPAATTAPRASRRPACQNFILTSVAALHMNDTLKGINLIERRWRRVQRIRALARYSGPWSLHRTSIGSLGDRDAVSRALARYDPLGSLSGRVRGTSIDL